MAEEKASTSNSSQISDQLEQLRARAQEHLLELADLDTREAAAAKKTADELDMEGRRRRSMQQAQGRPVPVAVQLEISGSDEERSKGPKLRTAQDVLDRLRWDPSFDIAEYTVGYLDRFGGIQTMQVSEWLRIREVTDEEFIPMHRIRWFKRRRQEGEGEGEGDGDEDGDSAVEETVWHREQRVDRIFGSG